MSTEITDKTHVVNTRSCGRFYITADQAEVIAKAIEGAGSDFALIEIEANRVRLSDITGVLTAVQMFEADRVKQGDWRCKFGYWHNRGEQCAHGQLRHS